MLHGLTDGEMILIRQAVREFRSVAPDHIKNDPVSLERWREMKELYANEIRTVDNKMTDSLAVLVDQQNT